MDIRASKIDAFISAAGAYREVFVVGREIRSCLAGAFDGGVRQCLAQEMRIHPRMLETDGSAAKPVNVIDL